MSLYVIIKGKYIIYLQHSVLQSFYTIAVLAQNKMNGVRLKDCIIGRIDFTNTLIYVIIKIEIAQ